MWTEPSPMQIMRDAIQPHLPPKAFLKRDRGEGLLVTNAPVFDPSLSCIPGFILEREGQLLRILPDEGWIEDIERHLPEPPDHFTRGFLRFKGMKPERNGLLLFARGLKLLDTGSAIISADVSAYDRALRSRAAEALRAGACGGGLYASAILLAQAKRLIKGEKST